MSLGFPNCGGPLPHGRGSETGTEFFQQRLAHYRNLTVTRVLEWLPSKEPNRYLYALVREHFGRGGKGLRPALCLATCRAFGGDPEDALYSAGAMEMLHNAFLVHDDVEDMSDLRHDHPTMQAQYGVPLAVNTGDAMQALSMRLLRNNLERLGPSLTWRIFDEFDHMLLQSLEGQAMELGWIRDNECRLGEEDYLRMVLKKTCWYSFIHPCRIGALIGTRGRAGLDRFNAFGYFLGAAFQIQDDVLNLVGSRGKYGKEIGGDLYEGKRTVILLHALNRCTPEERQRLSGLLATGRAQRQRRDIDWVYDLLAAYRSIDFARAFSRELLAASQSSFDSAYADAPEGEDKDFIRAMIRYVVDRDS